MEKVEKIKILMLEDVKDDAVMIERVLHTGGVNFVSMLVDTREEFIRGLKEFEPDVVLSDHSLPQFNSIEAHKICEKKNLNIPFILVTGHVSEAFAVECLRQGIDDYVFKTNLSRLPSAVLGALNNKRLEVLKKQAVKSLEVQHQNILKINKDLDNFVYSISNNLRSPLATVKGLLDIAKYDNVKVRDKELEQLHTMIETSIGKLDNTLKQVLEYSRNTRQEVIPEQIDIEKLINECFADLEHTDDLSGIAKRVTVFGHAPFYSDLYRMKLVFNALISNAVKYRDKTKKKTFVSIQASVADKHISIKIADNGIGIKEELLPKVFNIFFRAHETGDGAGLGLYIVKEVVDKLNGEIFISSIEHEETTVILRLPNMKPGEHHSLNG